MKPTQKQLAYFHAVLRQWKMMDEWADGLFVRTPVEGEERASQKALEAEKTFERIMRSNKNDGSFGYLEWAALTAIDKQRGPYVWDDHVPSLLVQGGAPGSGKRR